jgi:reductive dehalogenase
MARQEEDIAREVDQPTYQVVGQLQRFDERDNVFAREALIPGSPEEIEYHSRHPELLNVDRRLARFFLDGFSNDPQSRLASGGEALPEGVFGSVAALALPDAVDGPIAAQKAKVDSLEMARITKAIAKQLGASRVRIGPLNPAWVYSHRGVWPFFDDHPPNPPAFDGIPAGYQGLRYGDPMEIDHRFAITMAFPQTPALIGTSPSKLSSFEIGRVYAASALVAVELARYIRALGYPARAHHLRNYGVLLVPVAVDAGLGELGRCGYVINKALGANFRLACVTTDLPLAVDKPVDLGVQDFCEKCQKCARNCPTGAIPTGDEVEVRGVRKWQIDPEKCFLYWGSQGAACAICQIVCPWSKPSSVFHRFVAEGATRIPAARWLLVKADDWAYGAKYTRSPAPDWALNQGHPSSSHSGD